MLVCIVYWQQPLPLFRLVNSICVLCMCPHPYLLFKFAIEISAAGVCFLFVSHPYYVEINMDKFNMLVTSGWHSVTYLISIKKKRFVNRYCPKWNWSRNLVSIIANAIQTREYNACFNVFVLSCIHPFSASSNFSRNLIQTPQIDGTISFQFL